MKKDGGAWLCGGGLGGGGSDDGDGADGGGKYGGRQREFLDWGCSIVFSQL